MYSSVSNLQGFKKCSIRQVVVFIYPDCALSVDWTFSVILREFEYTTHQSAVRTWGCTVALGPCVHEISWALSYFPINTRHRFLRARSQRSWTKRYKFVRVWLIFPLIIYIHIATLLVRFNLLSPRININLRIQTFICQWFGTL